MTVQWSDCGALQNDPECHVLHLHSLNQGLVFTLNLSSIALVHDSAVGSSFRVFLYCYCIRESNSWSPAVSASRVSAATRLDPLQLSGSAGAGSAALK